MTSSRRRVLRGALLSVPVLAMRPPSSWGSLVLAMDLPELTSRAERILLGEVLDVRAAWDEGRRRIHSTVTVQVGEGWKGDAGAGAQITIVQPGGVVGDVEMRVQGLPSFATGERAVLFLRGRATSSLVGLGQGKRPLRLDQTTRRWMVERSDRSAAVIRDFAGRLQPAPPDLREPLDDFRGRVRALLGR